MMDDAEFHARVASILGVEDKYEYNPHTLGGTYRTRWNNRKPGNGRFEGRGIVRRFGNQVQVALRHPVALHCTFESAEDALKALADIMKDAR